MRVKYVCDVCDKEFDSALTCQHHEAQHFFGAEKVKYNLIHDPKEDICDYCTKSYYVYGCERDCEMKNCSFQNNYKDFVPVKPLHNKRAHGGV